ncbi:toll/interleukin-1 receptor domain-containing protein [Polaribacter sp. HaHaR_3_91]|jgi:hypothetical protein|uniref:toll/interleukin-1 receptor domain-containing protein n=1 Tax=Polaribacter sp. HaHaR_3_91 TaxID=2745561 RepID=UPI001C4FB5A2|nr:toll/interleukin-1 receptor domain-containing protein [Polaribacter sp. HaHaR_3_91]QXP63259.1 toll/interleukin-1 receptor domain-containing protein [Polaribacter sp. HaHaR_3_91]
MSIPKVFISYSHDSMEHKKWVLELAIRMRNNGIDAILDQWKLNPGDDLPHFMETNLASSDYTIMLCSTKYVEKANSGKGGVGYEKMIITSQLLEKIDENKIIPIIRQSGTQSVPTFLKSKLYINLSDSSDFEYGFDELIRTIHQSPLFKEPEIGNNPFKEENFELKELKNNDGILELMDSIVSAYEKTIYDWVEFEDLYRTMTMSKIYMEVLLKQAIELEYVLQNDSKDILLTDKGKSYALENNLV